MGSCDTIHNLSTPCIATLLYKKIFGEEKYYADLNGLMTVPLYGTPTRLGIA
jgi:hypothetical protein